MPHGCTSDASTVLIAHRPSCVCLVGIPSVINVLIETSAHTVETMWRKVTLSLTLDNKDYKFRYNGIRDCELTMYNIKDFDFQ